MEDIKGKNAVQEENENMSMEDLLKQSDLHFLEPGAIVTAKFIRKTNDGYLFDIGQKHEAIVPLSENIPDDILFSSDGIRTTVIKANAQEYSGYTLISYRAIVRKESVAAITEAFKNKTPVSGTVVKSVKGGYIVDLGVEAFLPTSHVVHKKENLIGKRINCLVIEAEDDNIVVSERLLSEMEKARAFSDIYSKYAVGDVVEGTVTSLTKFGAFVDIGGTDGLLHINDISWGNVEKVEDFLKPNQRIKVKILSINPDDRKISLGLKQLTENPWDAVAKKHSVGDVIKCTVKNITKFGVFCEIEEGVDGLLHISEVDWQNQNPPIEKMFSKGQNLEAKIVSIDAPRNKISLSIKRLKPSPWEILAEKITAGSRISATVVKLLPFGAVMKIADGVEGTLHIKNFDWFKSYSNPGTLLKVGQTLDVYVLDFDPAKQHVELSLKHLKPNPFEKYKLKTIVEGTVKKIIGAGVIILLEDDVEAFVPRAEVSRQKLETIESHLKVGEIVKGVVIASDASKRKIDVSLKRYEIAQEKKLLAKYSSDKPGPKLQEILEEI